MKIYTYSPDTNTDSCKAMKSMLDMTDKHVKESINVDLNQKIHQIVVYEYHKQCLFKDIKAVPTIDIQQWYDSK